MTDSPERDAAIEVAADAFVQLSAGRPHVKPAQEIGAGIVDALVESGTLVPPSLRAELRKAFDQRDLLGAAIGDLAVATGCAADVSMTGPMLLHMAEAMKHGWQAQSAELDAARAENLRLTASNNAINDRLTEVVGENVREVHRLKKELAEHKAVEEWDGILDYPEPETVRMFKSYPVCLRCQEPLTAERLAAQPDSGVCEKCD